MKEILTWLPMEAVALIASVLVMVCILRLAVYHPGRRVLKACEEFTGLLREKRTNSTWYQRNMLWLYRNGANFHYGRWVNPVRYLVLRLVLALLGFLVLWRVAPGYVVVAAIFLFFLPDWLLL